MKILLILSFIMTSAFSLETNDCYESLTNGHQDSAHFTQHSTNVYSNSAESLDEQMALNAVNLTLSQLGCDEQLVLSNIQCTTALNTILCRTNFKYGYFLILKDYVDTVNLIFNRWD